MLHNERDQWLTITWRRTLFLLTAFFSILDCQGFTATRDLAWLKKGLRAREKQSRKQKCARGREIEHNSVLQSIVLASVMMPPQDKPASYELGLQSNFKVLLAMLMIKQSLRKCFNKTMSFVITVLVVLLTSQIIG